LYSAIDAVHAIKGNVQLFNPKTGALQIIAHRGFDDDFLRLFENVRADEPSVCGRASQVRCRVMIPDITKDPLFSPYLSVARANGFRAVQSTPIVALDRSVIGMLSTHFAEITRLSKEDEIALDIHTAKIAQLIGDLLGDVQLRNHPHLRFGEASSWPPVWTNTTGRGETLRGEIGVLSKAYTSSNTAETCYLAIQHESESYVGALFLDDPALCQKLCSLLQQNVGRTISEIGSLEIAYSL
jgi:hypothetical protein